MIPAIIGAAAVQINLLIDTIVASLLTGVLVGYISQIVHRASLSYIRIAISIVILPVLSEYFQKKKLMRIQIH